MASWLPLSGNWHNYSSAMQGSLQPTCAESVFLSKQKATLLQKYLDPSKAFELVQTKRKGHKIKDTLFFLVSE